MQTDDTSEPQAIRVEVIYATPESQQIISIEVESGSTIQACINQSGVLTEYPEINLDEAKVGIFSQVKPLQHVVVEGDRIEIYRPLIADPKDVRRKKAAEAKLKG